MGPLSCRFKLGIDNVQTVALGQPGVDYERYMDDDGVLLSRFSGEERALMAERVLFKA